MSQAGITTRTGLKWSAGRSTSRVSSLLVVGLLIFAAGFSEEKDTKAITDALNQSMNKDSIKLVYMIGRAQRKMWEFHRAGPLFRRRSILLPHRRAGLVTIVPDGPGFWNVELANAKPQVLENLKKAKYNETDGCRSLTMFDTVATKSVVEVKRINKLINQKSEVEFTWKWTLAPTGIKLIDSLSQKQLSQLNDNLRNPALLMKHDDTFNLTDIRQSTTPQAAKKMLKKSGESWVVDQ